VRTLSLRQILGIVVILLGTLTLLVATPGYLIAVLFILVGLALCI